MPTLLWTGRLSPWTRFLMNVNNVLSAMAGGTRNTAAMKGRVRQGFDGEYTTNIDLYDEHGPHYPVVAEALLAEVELAGKKVLDVGCGSGVGSLRAVRKGAAEITCVDCSSRMLARCQSKLEEEGGCRSSFLVGDAEKLELDDSSFDVVVSSYLLGFIPDQVAALREMWRVLRPGGHVAIATHGPEEMWQCVWAFIKGLPIRDMMLPYRIEYWPRDEDALRRLLVQAGFDEVRTKRIKLDDEFPSPAEAFSSLEATSGLWMMNKYSRRAADRIVEAYKRSFERHQVTRLTHDAVMAYGRRPLE